MELATRFRFNLRQRTLKMVRVHDFEDYKTFSSTKQYVRQPDDSKPREDASATGTLQQISKSLSALLSLYVSPVWWLSSCTVNIQHFVTVFVRRFYFVTGGLDLIIVPGLAFTTTGIYLGHGLGLYDTYLTQVKGLKGRKPVTIALAFHQQVMPYLPRDHLDVVVDTVLTADK